VIAVARISTGGTDEDCLRALLLALMRSLGLARDRAEALIAQPLAPLDLDKESLFVRSQARFQKQKKRKRD